MVRPSLFGLSVSEGLCSVESFFSLSLSFQLIMGKFYFYVTFSLLFSFDHLAMGYGLITFLLNTFTSFDFKV